MKLKVNNKLMIIKKFFLFNNFKIFIWNYFFNFFFGAGKSILFSKKTIPKITTKAKTNFIIKLRIFVLELVFFINCI